MGLGKSKRGGCGYASGGSVIRRASGGRVSRGDNMAVGGGPVAPARLDQPALSVRVGPPKPPPMMGGPAMPPPAPAGAVMPPMGGNPMAMAGGMNGAPPMQAPMMANGGAVSRNLKVKGGAGGGLGRMQNAAAQKAKGA